MVDIHEKRRGRKEDKLQTKHLRLMESFGLRLPVRGVLGTSRNGLDLVSGQELSGGIGFGSLSTLMNVQV